MNELHRVAERVLELLRASGHHSASVELSELLEGLVHADVQLSLSLAERLRAMCSPRWLGDLMVSGVDVAEWWALLQQLARGGKQFAHRRVRKQG